MCLMVQFDCLPRANFIFARPLPPGDIIFKFREIFTECIPSCHLFHNSIYRILKQFEPFGPDNLNPIFSTQNLNIHGPLRFIGEETTDVYLLLSIISNASFVISFFNLPSIVIIL